MKAYRPSEVQVNGRRSTSSAAARLAAMVIIAGPLLLAADCTRQSSPSSYEVLNGTVASAQPDTGQLAIRSGGAGAETERERGVACLLTNDAEVYINDRCTTFDKIAVGDLIELIGYRDPNPRSERFVVSFAYITRTEARPPEPDLTPRATQPGDQS